MRRSRSISHYEAEITADVDRSGVYYGSFSSVGGTRENIAATRLQDAGVVKVVPYLNRPGRTDYVCIRPDAEWDATNFCVREATRTV